MTNIMDIGVSSLLAYQVALENASNNIANASDPNYCRRRVDFSENQAGMGVNVSDIARVADANAIQYSQASTMNFSEMNTYATQLQNLVSLFQDDSTGIGQSITNSLAALRDLSTNPNDAGGRNSYLLKLGSIAQQFQSINGQLNTNIQNANQSLANSAGSINQLLTNIASINNQIMNAPGVDKSGLEDQRDGLVDQLSTFVDFTTKTDSHGVMNITLSNGMSLVNNNNASVLTTMTDPLNPQNLILGMKNGSETMDLSDIIKSGSVAGLYTYRQDIEQTQTSLNRLSLAIAQSFNAQNKLGIDQNGAFGGNLFTDINSTDAINSRVNNDVNNSGTGSFTVDVTDVGQLKASDYQLVVGASNSYVIKRLSDNTVVSTGTFSGSYPQTISADGFSLNVNSGTFNAGDKYIISPTKNAASTMSVTVSDSSKLAFAFPVMTTPNSQNAGSAQLTVNSITDPSNSSFATPGALTPPVSVVFDATGTSYTITAGAITEGPIAYNPSNGTGVNIFPTPGGYDPGYRISIDISKGPVKGGDSFTIGYNTATSTDFRNGNLMIGLYGNKILDNGTTTFNQAYNATTNAVFTHGQDANNKSAIAEKLKDSADKARDEISGVSLPEESMDIQRFQQAYQASAQILQTARENFAALMGIFGG